MERLNKKLNALIKRVVRQELKVAQEKRRLEWLKADLNKLKEQRG